MHGEESQLPVSFKLQNDCVVVVDALVCVATWISSLLSLPRSSLARFIAHAHLIFRIHRATIDFFQDHHGDHER
jgi:hypothetical protein